MKNITCGLVLLILISLFFTACNAAAPTAAIPSEPPASPSSTQPPLPSATRTKKPVQPTDTLAPPTNTAVPTATLELFPTIAAKPHPFALAVGNAGTEMKRLARLGKGSFRDTVWSPDGKRLAVATSLGVYIFDTNTWQQIRFLDANGSVNRVAFHPDSQVIALAMGGAVSIWNVDSGQQLLKMDGEMLGGIWALVYGRGGHVAAFGQQFPGAGEAIQQVMLWNAATGQLLYQQGEIFTGSNALDISPDGTQLLHWGTSGLVIYDINNDQQVSTLHEMVFDAVFSPDGTSVYFSCFELDKNWLQIWDMSSGSTKPVTPDFPSIDLARNGRAVVHFGGSTGLLAPSIQGDFEAASLVRSATVSPDGQFLAYRVEGSTIIHVREVATGAEIHTIDFPAYTHRAVGISVLDGTTRYVAAIAYFNEIQLIDLPSGTLLRTIPKDESEVRGLAFSPDRRTLASVDENHDVRIWNVQNGAELTRYHPELDVDGPLLYSPDGTRLALMTEVEDHILELDLQSGVVENWEPGASMFSYAETLTYPPFLYNPASQLQTWEGFFEQKRLTVKTLSTGQQATFDFPVESSFSWIETIAISPEGKYLAAGADNGEIFVWEVSRQELIQVLQGHTVRATEGWIGAIEHLEFSPVNDLLVSVGHDGSTRLWNVRAGTQLRQLSVCCYMGFVPDGRFLVTSSSDILRVWGIE